MFLYILFLFLGVNIIGLNAQDVAPCNTKDIPCIRRYLADHSKCDSRIFGKMPNTYYGVNARFKVPYFNVSHNDQQFVIKNLDKCAVSAFYRNKTANTLVLGIKCENVHFDTERAFIFHRRDRIDRLRVIRVVADYDTVAITMNMHGGEYNLNLCSETAYAFTSLPTLFLQGRDRASVEFVKADPYGMFGEHLDIWIREIWGNRATPLFQALVNNVLCDFNCRFQRTL